MYYLFERGLKRLYRNKKKYLLLIFQVIVGMCMISLSLNMIFNYQLQMMRMEDKLSHPYATISSRGQNNISSDDWEIINAQWPNENLSFYFQYDVSTGNSEDVNILFVDESFYENVLGIQLGSNSGKTNVFANTKAQNALLAGAVNDPELQPYCNLNDKTFFGFSISDFTSLDDEELRCPSLLTYTIYESDSICIPSFKDAIILPLSAKGNLPCSSYIVLPFEIGEEESVNQLAIMVQEKLLSVSENPDIEIRNYYTEIQGIVGRNSVLARMLTLIAAFILAVVVFGLTGLLLVFLNQRKREIAVAIMCGAKQSQIVEEVFFEAFSVVFIGTVIGNPLCSIFLPMFGGLGVVTNWTPIPLLFCILLAVIISLFVVLLLIVRIYALSPITTLKEL